LGEVTVLCTTLPCWSMTVTKAAAGANADTWAAIVHTSDDN